MLDYKASLPKPKAEVEAPSASEEPK